MSELSRVAKALQTLEDEILVRMASRGAGPEHCFWLKGLVDEDFSYDLVRTLVRGLSARGLAFYARGLFNDDGEVAGSGYGLTEEGLRHVSSLIEAEGEARA